MSYTSKIPSYDRAAEFGLYIAEPVGKPRAAVVVIQEIFGVDTEIRRKCDLFAQKGYLAVAPDLFWRLEPGLELDPDSSSSTNRSINLVIRFDTDKGVHDVQTTINHARDLAGRTAKVGLVGFCLGGRMACYAAARTDIDASVSYYGVQIERMLGEKNTIVNPLLLHIPEFDPYVDKDIQFKIHRAFDEHPKLTLYDYPGQHHGFACEFGKRRSEEGAHLADQRTMTFLESNLT